MKLVRSTASLALVAAALFFFVGIGYRLLNSEPHNNNFNEAGAVISIRGNGPGLGNKGTNGGAASRLPLINDGKMLLVQSKQQLQLDDLNRRLRLIETGSNNKASIVTAADPRHVSDVVLQAVRDSVKEEFKVLLLERSMQEKETPHSLPKAIQSPPQHHESKRDTIKVADDTNCEPAVLTVGQVARTQEEVMAKSKLDKQYYNGIQNKPNVGALVDSKKYWETRYAMGGNSGAGSYNAIGAHKADVVNEFVADNNVHTVIEFGFGDGQQLTRAKYPEYIGVDVSETIMEKTSNRFKDDDTKHFQLYDGKVVPGLTGDLSLSFDVIYHLVEDQVYFNYMEALFAASSRYVIVYSSNIDGWHGAAHVLHRNNTKYIAKTFPNWKNVGSLRNKYPEKTAQDFFFYAKCQ